MWGTVPLVFPGMPRKKQQKCIPILLLVSKTHPRLPTRRHTVRITDVHAGIDPLSSESPQLMYHGSLSPHRTMKSSVPYRMVCYLAFSISRSLWESSGDAMKGVPSL